MTAPVFQIAVRKADGEAMLLRVQHAEIATHEHAIELTRDEFPDAKAILCTVEKE